MHLFACSIFVLCFLLLFGPSFFNPRYQFKVMVSLPQKCLWSEVQEEEICIKCCLNILSAKDVYFCRMMRVSVKDDSILATHSMFTPYNKITFPSHGSSVADSPAVSFHHSEITASYTIQSLKILVFWVCSLFQTPLIPCVNSLFRHCKQNCSLKLIIHEGYTLTYVCQCIHFVPYVLKVSSRGEYHGIDLPWDSTHRWCSRQPRSLRGILSVLLVVLKVCLLFNDHYETNWWLQSHL